MTEWKTALMLAPCPMVNFTFPILAIDLVQCDLEKRNAIIRLTPRLVRLTKPSLPIKDQ
jgi:hypothetical protein